MKIINTNIDDVKILEPTIYEDERGFFMESWNQDKFDQEFGMVRFVQDNHSKSCKGILRGLHFQTENTQGKLVRVTSGEVFDVAVDLRCDSKTYGHWVGTYLSSANRYQMWIPEGFAHGFYVTSDTAEFVYKCTDYYNPKAEKTIAWNDPDLNISWPVTVEPILSAKDNLGVPFNSITGFKIN